MKTYHKIHGLYKRYREGEKKGKFIIGQYSRPEFELLKNITWIWTEKIDGTNIRIIFRKNENITSTESYELLFKGKTDKAELPKHLYAKLEELFTKDKILSIMTSNMTENNIPNICLYGEGYGYKIQSGGKYFKNPKDVGFVLFDIRIGNTWLKREDIEDIARQLGIDIVPIIGEGTIDKAIAFIKSNPMSIVACNGFVMEGLVIRPKYELLDRRGHRIITKIKVKDFKEE